MSAHRQDRRYAGDGLKLAFDHEIVQFPEVGVEFLAFRVNDFPVRLKIVDEDLPEPAGNRPEFRSGDVGGQPRFCGTQALRDKLAREIDIRLVLEIDINHAHAEAGSRFYESHVRQTAHRAFDRLGDHEFDFLGGESGRFREDRHHDRGYIRECVARRFDIGIDSESDYREHEDQDRHAEIKPGLDYFINHIAPSVSVTGMGVHAAGQQN